MSEGQQWAGQFGERIHSWVVEVMRFVDGLPKTVAILSICRQLVDATGSTGANYIEARGARSRKEFISSLGISAKECKEALYWLALLRDLLAEQQHRVAVLHQEGNEIASILTSMCRNAKLNETSTAAIRT